MQILIPEAIRRKLKTGPDIDRRPVLTYKNNTTLVYGPPGPIYVGNDSALHAPRHIRIFKAEPCYTINGPDM
jgi:hypothetical protein